MNNEDAIEIIRNVRLTLFEFGLSWVDEKVMTAIDFEREFEELDQRKSVYSSTNGPQEYLRTYLLKLVHKFRLLEEESLGNTLHVLNANMRDSNSGPIEDIIVEFPEELESGHPAMEFSLSELPLLSNVSAELRELIQQLFSENDS